jgi:hypothetical protein
MKLIFLYGPPAVGKYTVAKSLSEKTGYKLFHNHATVDLVESVFAFGTMEFWNLVDKIRLDFFELAAKENIPGLIFTFVYAKDSDDGFVKKVIEKVTLNKGEIIFIQLFCEREDLLKRVIDDSRKQFQKIKTIESLSEMLEKNDLFESIPFVKSYKIDNTKITVDETVKRALEFIK